MGESQKTDTDSTLRNEVISWVTYDSRSAKKTGDWYFVLWTIALTGTVLSFILNNPLFGILLIVSAFTATIYASRKPKKVEVVVNKKEVRVDTVSYLMSNLSHYSINEEGLLYLLLKSKKTFDPLWIVPLSEDAHIDSLKNFLDVFLEEEEMELPFYQKVIDRLGF